MRIRAWIAGILAALVLGAALVGLRSLRPAGSFTPVSLPSLDDSVLADPEPAPAAAIVFHEFAREAGIDFRYQNGARGLRYLPETFGGGVALLDYDGDGWLDIFLVQGGPFPPGGVSPYTNQLFRNNRDGTFTDVTAQAGVGRAGYGVGCAAGDYDNDGDPDLYVVDYGPDVLYRNNGDGSFSDVTAEAGLGCPLWGISAAFGDLDGDGDLDLYVTHYADIAIPHHVPCYDASGLPVHCPPTQYRPLPDLVYRNNGDGTFTDVTAQAGVRDTDGRGIGVLIADLDRDGRQDIYVANDQTNNFFYRSTGPFAFEEQAEQLGPAFNRDGQAEGSMGVAYGDYDRDGRSDLLVTNFYLETNTVYRNLGGGFFRDETQRTGLGPPSKTMVAWGTQFVDFDHDGWLDLFVTNGHIDNIEEQTKVPYAMHPQLFYNLGNGRFADVSTQAGPYFQQRWVGRSAAFGDIDNDGDVDVAVTHLSEPFALLRNDTPRCGRFLVLQLIGQAPDAGNEQAGRGSNRDAVGARVTARAGKHRWTHEVIGGGSYLSASDRRVFLGLGETERLDQLEVVWPSGRKQTWNDLTIDRPGQALAIVEGHDPRPLAGYIRP